MQNLHDKVYRESGLGRVSGHRVFNTTQGKVIIPTRSGGGGAGTIGAPMKIRVVYDGYLVCRDWDGATIGETDIYVAKPEILRCTVNSEEAYRINSGTSQPEWVTVNYTYTDDEEEPFMAFDSEAGWGEEEEDYEEGGALFEFRLNAIRAGVVGEEANTVYSQVVPIYKKGQVIRVVEVDFSGVIREGEELDLMEILPSRQWAAIS